MREKPSRILKRPDMSRERYTKEAILCALSRTKEACQQEFFQYRRKPADLLTDVMGDLQQVPSWMLQDCNTVDDAAAVPATGKFSHSPYSWMPNMSDIENLLLHWTLPTSRKAGSQAGLQNTTHLDDSARRRDTLLHYPKRDYPYYPPSRD